MKYRAPRRDLCGIGPQTSEWTKSSGLDSLNANVGCDATICLPYWKCSQNWWSKKVSFGIYPALDKFMMSALLICLSRPCHNDDTGMSTRNKSPSLSVTYSGYNECTFGPRASRRFPLWSVHPPEEKLAWLPSLSKCLTEINGHESSGMCQMFCSTNVETPERLSLWCHFQL